MKARDNPFSVDRVHAIPYRLSEENWNRLLQKLESFNHRAAIVGQHGAGKSTLLKDLGRRLQNRGFRTRALRLTREKPAFSRRFLQSFFSQISPEEIILLDGAEQMSLLAWQRFKRRSRKVSGLVITSHRAGMLPTLHHCTTTPQLLESIVRKLLDKTNAEDWNETHRRTTEALFHKHRGNVRDALRDLYDQFARDENPFPSRLSSRQQ